MADRRYLPAKHDELVLSYRGLGYHVLKSLTRHTSADSYFIYIIIFIFQHLSNFYFLVYPNQLKYTNDLRYHLILLYCKHLCWCKLYLTWIRQSVSTTLLLIWHFRLVYRKWKYVFNLFLKNFLSGKITAYGHHITRVEILKL